MNVACPHCPCQYEVDGAVFGVAPRTVKCSHCGWEWLHLPTGADIASPAAEASPASDAAPREDVEMSFGEAMAAAQQAIEAESAAGVASQHDAVAAPVVADGLAASALPAAAAGVKDGNTVPATERPASRLPAAADDDFEIELGSDDGAADASPEADTPPSSPPRVPRWVVGFSAALATATVLVVIFLAGKSILLDAVPQAAGIYRMFGVAIDAVGAGLEIGDVASLREWSDGEEALIVSGHITNTTPGPMTVPPLKVALYNEADKPLQSVTVLAAGKVLLSGESTAFRARIPTPQDAAQRIKITFDAAGS